MTCKNCGAPIEEGMKFCINCGSAVEPETKVDLSNPYAEGTPVYSGETAKEDVAEAATEKSVTEEPATEAVEEEKAEFVTEEVPPYEEPMETYMGTVDLEPAIEGSKGLAIAAMVCGILSLVCCCTVYLGFMLAIVAVVLGIISMSKKDLGGKGMALAGIITGACGLLIGIISIIISATISNAVDSFDFSSPEEIEEFIEQFVDEGSI